MGGTEAVQTSKPFLFYHSLSPRCQGGVTTEKQHGLGQWLSDRCREEHLSLRQAAVRSGLSHATLAQVIKSDRASPETIRKLTMGFGGDGINERLALEDYLLMLSGYRTPRPEGEEISESLARLIDKARRFSEPQLRMMVSFADFLIEMDERGKEPEGER